MVDDVEPLLHRQVFETTTENESTHRYLAENRLIHNTMQYPRCNIPMAYCNEAALLEGKSWYCRGYKKRKSILLDSFFTAGNKIGSKEFASVSAIPARVRSSLPKYATGPIRAKVPFT